MVIPNIEAIMCANMVVQNTLRMQQSRREERQRKVQPTFQSTFNKEKQKQRER